MTNLAAMVLVGLALAVLAGIVAWSIRYYTRIIGYLVSVIQAPRVSWGVWSERSVDGMWEETPVKIRACYTNPPTLQVAIRRATSPPELDAYVNRSGKVEFRSIRTGLLLIRAIARASEDDLSGLNGQHASTDITSYFTPARIAHVKVLLGELGWRRFVKNKDGLSVSVSGAMSSRWTPDQARDRVAKTLAELRSLGAQ